MVKKIGLLGGSFDPIHFGHLSLAVEMREAHHLDEIWLCPTAQNPLKPEQCAVTVKHRLQMLHLAAEGIPWIKIIEEEIHRKSPCYFIDTLQQLVSDYPDVEFSVIIGDDSANTFHLWHKPEEIIKCARLLVGARNGSNFQGTPAVIKALKMGMTPTRIMEISSTEIRQRLADGLYCGHLVPAKVLDYILTHRLYCR